MLETTKNAAIASTGVSTTSGVIVATGKLETISQYAPLIGLGLSLTSIILAIVFFCINHRQRSIRDKRYISELRESLKDELREELLKSHQLSVNK